MIPKKVKVAFEGVNRLYTYFDDQHDLSPEDVVYVEGKMWKKPGQVREVTEANSSDRDQYNRILKKILFEVHGTYYSYGPYMFCFDQEAIPFEHFKSWVSPPDRKLHIEHEMGFDLSLEELGYCDFASEEALRYGLHCFQEEQVEFLSLIDGRGQALVKDGARHTVTFDYDGKMVRNMICRKDTDRFCEHDIGTCLTLRTLLRIFQNEFADYYVNGRFTAVNRNIFYRIVAYSLKKITL